MMDAQPTKLDEKINCRVLNRSDGGKHLVFTVDGTERCVGEISFVGDERYLLVIAKMFSGWADIKRGALINGHRHR